MTAKILIHPTAADLPEETLALGIRYLGKQSESVPTWKPKTWDEYNEASVLRLEIELGESGTNDPSREDSPAWLSAIAERFLAMQLPTWRELSNADALRTRTIDEVRAARLEFRRLRAEPRAPNEEATGD